MNLLFIAIAMHLGTVGYTAPKALAYFQHKSDAGKLFGVITDFQVLNSFSVRSSTSIVASFYTRAPPS